MGVLCEVELKTAEVEELETCKIKEQEQKSSAVDDSLIYLWFLVGIPWVNNITVHLSLPGHLSLKAFLGPN